MLGFKKRGEGGSFSLLQDRRDSAVVGHSPSSAHWPF